jgi:universal stress protein A
MPRRPVLRFGIILCPPDFSESSQKALEAADELAAHFRAELFRVHIVPFLPPIPATPNVTFNRVEYETLLHSEAEARLLELRDALSAKTPESTHPGRTRVRCRGDFAHRKARECRLNPYSDARGDGLERVVFGSVTEKVVRTAGCPVLAIRPEGR